jgi:hypothetical protein
MAYTIQSIVAKAGVFPTQPLDHLKAVSLEQGIEMVPLTTRARRHYGIPRCPLTFGEASELPQALTELCCQLSRRGTVAYIEADLFGGYGAKAHVIFNGGAALGPAVVSKSAINGALRALGVSASGAFDEFDAVGLGKHRFTDKWLE